MHSVTDRRRAVARLALLSLAIIGAFLAVTLSGVGPSDAQRWGDGAGAAGRMVLVMPGGALARAPVRGLAHSPGEVTATLAGVLFGAVAGTGLALAATLLAAGLALVTARRIGA